MNFSSTIDFIDRCLSKPTTNVTFNMAFVFVFCLFGQKNSKISQINLSIIYLALNNTNTEIILYFGLLLLNFMCLKLLKKSHMRTYSLLSINIIFLIFFKRYCYIIGTNIKSKSNISIQMILLIPKIFYLCNTDSINIIEGFYYIFFLPGMIAGPVIPYEDLNIKKKIQTNFLYRKIFEILLFGCLHLLIKKMVPEETLYSVNNGNLKKIVCLFIFGVGYRSQYYFIWAFSSVCHAIHGYHVDNIDVFKFETSKNIGDLSRSWNVYSASFLKECAFKPLCKISPFLGGVATFILSSLWHGGHPCYFMMFLAFGLSAVGLKNNQRLFIMLFGETMGDIFSIISVLLYISFFSTPFYFLDIKKTMLIWKSVKFYGIWFMAATYFFYAIQRIVLKKH